MLYICILRCFSIVSTFTLPKFFGIIKWPPFNYLLFCEHCFIDLKSKILEDLIVKQLSPIITEVSRKCGVFVLINYTKIDLSRWKSTQCLFDKLCTEKFINSTIFITSKVQIIMELYKINSNYTFVFIMFLLSDILNLTLFPFSRLTCTLN